MGQSVDKQISDVLAKVPRGAQCAALCAVADELLTAGDVDGALKCFDRALQNDVKSARAWTGRATVLAHRRRSGEAFGCIHRALDERAAYAPALVLKAEVLVQTGRRAEALACCREVFAADSELAEHWVRRGRVFEDLERPDEAADAYASAIAIENTATPWFRRAQLFVARGKPEDAAHDFARAVAAEPSYFDAWYLLAQTYLELGRMTDMKFALERFVALAPAESPRSSTARKMLLDLAAPRRASVPAPNAVAAPQTPESTKKPETPETPESTKKPEKPETPESTKKPETPESAKTPETPETPELGVAYRRSPVSAFGAPSREELDLAARSEVRGVPALHVPSRPPPSQRVAPPPEVRQDDDDDELELTRNADSAIPPPPSRAFYLNEIDALYAAGKHLEALRRIAPILTRSPDDVEALLCQAKILVALGELEVAVTSLERVTRVERRHVFAFTLMAACWRELKRPDRALEMAERVLALAPLEPTALQLRADCLRELDRSG